MIGRPNVIAHRGACGYRPEHTMAAYELAVQQGADALELDVVITRDGVLVCRHEHQVGDTTDIAAHPELADLLTTRLVPGRSKATGWFTEDLTLDQLRDLRARERLPKLRLESAEHDGLYPVPTFAEVLEFVSAVRRTRPLPLLVEIKHPGYFASLGLPILDTVLGDLSAAGLDGADAEVVLECFEPTALHYLAQRSRVILMQLLEEPLKRPADLVAAGDPRTFGDLLHTAALARTREYAGQLGVHTDLVLPRDPSGATGAASTLVGDAHKLGFEVSVFTLRRENHFLPVDYRRGEDPGAAGDLAGQAEALAATGVDGLMTDNPDVIGGRLAAT